MQANKLVAIVVFSTAAAAAAAAVLFLMKHNRKPPTTVLPQPSLPPPPPVVITKKRKSQFLLRSQIFDFHPPLASTLNATFREIARDYCPELFDFDDQDISISQLRGGITNLLWKVTNKHGKSVLIRAYGENTEVLIDRDSECEILQELSRIGFAPKLYGLFANGRVEEYLDFAEAFEPCNKMGEPEYAPLIAREMKRMHAINEVQCITNRTPQLWPVLTKFLALSSAIELDGVDTVDLKQFANEMQWLRTVLPNEDNDELEISPKAKAVAFRNVLAHNDLLGGNILYLKQENRVQFIDFEYGAYNYAAFDVANHFCEYAGFDFDLERWYPTREQQHLFWRAYLGDEEQEVELLDELMQWTNKFALAANALWFMWAIVQAKHSKIDGVDFLAFAQRRRAGYFAQKWTYFGLGKA